MFHVLRHQLFTNGQPGTLSVFKKTESVEFFMPWVTILTFKLFFIQVCYVRMKNLPNIKCPFNLLWSALLTNSLSKQCTLLMSSMSRHGEIHMIKHQTQEIS